MKTRIVLGIGLAAALIAGLLILKRPGRLADAEIDATSSPEASLVNVSYDVSRELWKELNAAFIPQHQSETGVKVSIQQSHAGSSNQARAVIDGLDADVVTLNLWLDTDAIHRSGLIRDGWEDAFPNRSLPYTSTIVFVVRAGNPKQIADWPDLIRPDVSIVVPNPKTSGNGKYSFLAAWGHVVRSGGTPAEARAFVEAFYRNVPVLESGGRGASVAFGQKGIGDALLTFENEARLAVAESGGKLEIVYPSDSILVEPHVAVIDANIDRRGTRETAEAYLRFLYTPEAQEIIARHFYRPVDEAVLARHASRFPELRLFQVTEIADGWNAAHREFFADDGVFDRIYSQFNRQQN